MRPHVSDSARESAGADRPIPRGPSAPPRRAPDGTPQTPADLQRTAGNAAVVQLLRQSGHFGNEDGHQPEANATRVLSGSAPVRETVRETAPVHGSGAAPVQRTERNGNPHAERSTHEGWSTTAHHIVGHSQVIKALDSVDGHHREMLLRQAVPEVITETMLRELAIKIPDHRNPDDFKKRLRVALVKTGKSAEAAFPLIDFDATRRAFYEWQGGNQFVGPNATLRAEPTDNGDDTDLDGEYISPLPEADFGQLTELGDKLKVANKEGDKKAQYQLMNRILTITVNVSPNPFDASLWSEVSDAAKVARLKKILKREHMDKYSYFKITRQQLDQVWFAGITRNPTGSGFLYAGEPLKSPFEKGSFLYLKSDDKQKTPSEVPLLDILSGVQPNGEFTEFDRPHRSEIDGNFLKIPDYKDIHLAGLEALPSGRCRIRTPKKPKMLESAYGGMELSEYCRQEGVPLSTFLPAALVEAND